MSRRHILPASSIGRALTGVTRQPVAPAPQTAPAHHPPLLCIRAPPGGLSLWLVVWLVLGKPSPASACPHLCVCYPTPMTVSCQAQNFTAVPVGVPYESQRVFLQNNRITELRVGSFGFGTQVRRKRVPVFALISNCPDGSSSLNCAGVFSRTRSFGCFPTTSRGSRQGPSAS